VATWQYRAWVVPADRAASGSETAREILDEEDPDVWEGVAPGWGKILADALDLAPSRIAWSPKTLAWGTSDGSNVSECTEDGIVREVGCNIDVRALDTAQIDRFSRALKSIGAMLVDAQGNAVEADTLELLAAIHRSAAFRFVEDPRAFLDELEKRRSRH
jgi:hypothetical protein